MEIIESVFSFIQSGDLIGFFTKLFGIALGGIYLFFTIIMMYQIMSLKKLVELSDKGVLLILSYFQVIIATVLILYSILVL